MNPGEIFADRLAERTIPALAGPNSRRDVFAIGDVRFELSAPPDGSTDWLGRAFLPMPPGNGPTPVSVHRLFAWDATQSEAMPPRRPWAADAHEPMGVVQDYTNENVRCALDIHTGSLIVYDYRNDTSFTWLPSIAEMPAWARASPFRIALSWLVNRHGMQLIHGAAVSVGTSAALLTGPGGAGKSTTALACALSGMDYLGDDYCAIEPASGRVHMIYRTAKVLPNTLSLLPSLRPLLVNADQLGVEKGVMFLDEDTAALRPSADLKVILIPRLSSERQTTFTPATRAEVISAVLPSTIGGTMGGTAVTPGLILRMAQSLPGFYLNLGTDLDGVAAAVKAKLGEY